MGRYHTAFVMFTLTCTFGISNLGHFLLFVHIVGDNRECKNICSITLNPEMIS